MQQALLAGGRLSPRMEPSKAGRWGGPVWLWALLVWAAALLLIFARSMHADVDVDEHPFIASAAVMARHGLIPYRDYHYNHMPTEVMVYAGLFRVFSHLLMAARCFQTFCAAATVVVLFCVAYGALAFLPAGIRLAFSAATAALVLANPLFYKTSGLCWNHDFPLLMALLAFVVLRRGTLARRGGAALAGLSGFLFALAVTTRLTFAAAGAGYLVLILAFPDTTWRRKLLLLAAMGLGFAIASLPSAWVWAQSPRNAWFGNFLYPRLNTRIHEERDSTQRFTLFSILLYYLRNIVYLPGNGILTLGFAALMARAVVLRRRLGGRVMAQVWAVLVLVAGLTGSGFMPAPPFLQYFYAAMPFMILGVLLCLSAMPELFDMPRLMTGTIAGWGICLAFGVGAYGAPLFHLPMLASWVPLQAHRIGLEVARKAHASSVFTMEPIFPLEGGLDVDERLTTCRFGLRTAPLLDPRDRKAYLMPTEADIPQMLRRRHMAALIVKGTDWRIDRATRLAAIDAGYEKILLRGRGEIWRPPVSSR